MSEPLLHPNQGVQASTPVVQHQNWTTPLTPNSGTPTRASSRATRSRPTRGSTLVPQSSTSPAPHAAPASAPPPAVPPTQAARGQLQATRQAHLSSYAARMRTGASLLMQPLVAGVAAPAAGPSNAAAPAVEPRTAVPVPRATASAPTRTTGRGRTQVNYTEPGSADEFEEEEEPGSEDSDFVASGGVRQSIRRLGGTVATSRAPGGRGGPSAAAGAKAQVSEVIQSYLGQVPPTRLAVPRPFKPTPHEYFSEERLAEEAARHAALVPIRVEIDTDSHRIRDAFVWDAAQTLLSPEVFARTFCADLDLPAGGGFADTIAAQIRAQLEDGEPIAGLRAGADIAWADARQPAPSDDLAMLDAIPEPLLEPGEEIPECRVIVAIDVQIGTCHLQDHIEWDLLSPLTPEAFARQLCAELGLSGEAVPLVAHAVHEELLKHTRDAVEWGVLGAAEASGGGADDTPGAGGAGVSVLKDRTGLGLGWGKAPKDGRGRGPKTLKSVWRDWAEAEEFATRFEELTPEEVERRELERERATRRLRRETSKFQSGAGRRRR